MATWISLAWGTNQVEIPPWGASQHVKEAEGPFLGSTSAEGEGDQQEQSQRQEKSWRAPESSEFRTCKVTPSRESGR